ncbi:MAG: hypothetical protein EP343_26600 [Deltaproteobacteria bacterium]|nr:MAG: hypothetical protein EP343_26600 [Deltaproteobacteria bacterium]
MTPENNLMLLVTMKMPYGQYEGRYICDLPEHYLVWYHNEGFPSGQLGELMASMYEIRLNGLEYLLKPLRPKQPRHFHFGDD